MTKFFKIFVVSLFLVSLLTVSCFATSAQTTNVFYGHYISPGEYVLNDTLDLSYSFEIFVPFSSGNHDFTSLGVRSSPNSLFYIRLDGLLNMVYGSSGYVDGDLYRSLVFSSGFYIYDPVVFQWWQSNVTRVSPGYDSNLFDGFFSVFTMIGQWVSGALNNLTSIFWLDGSLTFYGVLCISALSLSVIFLLIGFISIFLRFRG